MIRKIKDYYCDYCGEPIDFGNLCQTCKSKKRRGVKLVKMYKRGVLITDTKPKDELDQILQTLIEISYREGLKNSFPEGGVTLLIAKEMTKDKLIKFFKHGKRSPETKG